MVQLPKEPRHCAEVERCHQELCPSGPFLAPRLRHSWPLDSGQYSSCPAVASYFQWGTLQEPGELLPLFFWALRPFSGEEQGMSNLMRVHTTDRHGGRRCDHPHLGVPSLMMEARYRVYRCACTNILTYTKDNRPEELRNRASYYEGPRRGVWS